MKLYISGPMSGIPEKNLTEFKMASNMVRVATVGGVEQGLHNPVTPFDLDVVEPCSEDDWTANMKRDIKWLPTFDGVVAIKGWEQSKGARIEIALAFWLGIPIYYIPFDITKWPDLVRLPVSVDLEIASLIDSAFWN